MILQELVNHQQHGIRGMSIVARFECESDLSLNSVNITCTSASLGTARRGPRDPRAEHEQHRIAAAGSSLFWASTGRLLKTM